MVVIGYRTSDGTVLYRKANGNWVFPIRRAEAKTYADAPAAQPALDKVRADLAEDAERIGLYPAD